MIALAPAAGYRTGKSVAETALRSADVFVVASNRTPGERSKRPVHIAMPITLQPELPSDPAPTIEVSAGRAARVQAHYEPATERAIYAWGRLAHATLSESAALLRWIAQVALGDPRELRQLLGHFVVIIDDRRQREVTFVCDVLGIRPWFTAAHDGQLVAGSNVLELCAAGHSSGRVDYDAVSCWLKYNQMLDGASVSADYRGVAPGSVTTFDASGKPLRRAPYGALEYRDATLGPDEVVDRLHAIVSSSLDLLVRDETEVNLPVSGGYDSRYLFALAARRTRTRPLIRAATLRTREYEADLARQVAEALGRPIEIVSSRTRIADLFDDPFAFNGAGFPAGRNLTNALARRHPGTIVVSGFLGDGVMRGSMTAAGAAHFEKDRANLPGAELADILDARYAMQPHHLPLLHQRVQCNASERARATMQRLIDDGRATGKPLLYADLFARHRLYFANIFLQHLDVAESVAPYCTWELLNCRTSLANQCFTADNFPRLLRRHFPRLAGIPHSFDVQEKARLGKPKSRRAIPATRHLRRWSASLAGTLISPGSLGCVQKRRALALLRDTAASSIAANGARYEWEITFLYKLLLLERRLHECGLDFDWQSV